MESTFSIVVLMILILTACSSSSTVKKQEEKVIKFVVTKTEKMDEENTSKKDQTDQTVTYKDISFSIPYNWSTENIEDGGVGIHSSSDSGFGCIVMDFDLSDSITNTTSKNEVYDYCMKFMSIDTPENSEVEKVFNEQQKK